MDRDTQRKDKMIYRLLGEFYPKSKRIPREGLTIIRTAKREYRVFNLKDGDTLELQGTLCLNMAIEMSGDCTLEVGHKEVEEKNARS